MSTCLHAYLHAYTQEKRYERSVLPIVAIIAGLEDETWDELAQSGLCVLSEGDKRFVTCPSYSTCPLAGTERHHSCEWCSTQGQVYVCVRVCVHFCPLATLKSFGADGMVCMMKE